MATLTGSTIASTYKDLLQVSNSNSGVDATARAVSDGEGTASLLYLSTTEVYSPGTGGTSNTAFGKNAGDALTTNGNYNVVLGEEAGTAITTGDNNTLIGYAAGDALVGMTDNTAIGYNALTGSSAVDSTVIIGSGAGAGALTAAADGTVLIGYTAGAALTSGADNLAIGETALLEHTTGVRNLAIGNGAMNATQAGGTQSTSAGSNDNIFIGFDSGGGAWTDAGTDENVCIGNYTMDANCADANTNVVIGHNAGSAITSAGNNTLVGGSAGNLLLTGPYNICLGFNVQASDTDRQDQYTIGRACSNTANSTILFGVAGNTLRAALDGSTTSWTAASSDERLKENIATSTAGLSFINDLRPVTYNWKKQKDIDKDFDLYKTNATLIDEGELNDEAPCLGHNFHEYGHTYHGFIAQEVKTVIDNHPELKEGFGMYQEAQSEGQTHSVSDGALIPMLVKAVQELSAKITVLENA